MDFVLLSKKGESLEWMAERMAFHLRFNLLNTLWFYYANI